MTDKTPAPLFTLRRDYKEPTSLDEFKRRVASFTPESPGTIFDVQIILGDMLERIATLEAAVLPFAVAGMNMAQARLMLNAKGMQTTPAGGTWISTLNNISVTAADAIFYDAIDALGHARVNVHMQEQFAAMQRAMKASDERDDHVEAGGATH